MRNRRDLVDAIARTIRTADTRYFFEDYTRQAEAVLQMLAQENLTIVPRSLTDEMVEQIKDQLPYGRQRPEDMLRSLWDVMIRVSKHEQRKRMTGLE